MLKSMIIASLSVVILLSGSLEAQIFRRFAAPRQPSPPAGRYAPQGDGYQPYGGYAAPQRTYYRRVQIAPGRFALVPVQPNGTYQQGAPSPQDIARKQAEKNTKPEPDRSADSPSLEGPRSTSSITTQNAVSPVGTPRGPQAQQTQPMYRRVTVYDPRTGQRSVRLISVPPNSLAQQPYVYGQNPAAAMNQSARQSSGSTDVAKVVNGTLLTPVQTAKVPTSMETIRLDSQVKQATFDQPPIRSGQPNVASVTPMVAPQPQPAIASPAVPAPVSPDDEVSPVDGQFSVLDFGDEPNDSSSADGGPGLAPPAN